MDRRRWELGRRSQADIATARVPRDRRQPGVRGGRTGPAAGDPRPAGARTRAAPAAARSESDSARGRAAAPTAAAARQAPDVRGRSRSLPRDRRGAATERTRPPVRQRPAVPALAGDRRRRGLADDAKRRRGRHVLPSIGLPAAAPPVVTRARSPRASREPSACCARAAAASTRRSRPRGCSRKWAPGWPGRSTWATGSSRRRASTVW